MTRSFALTTEIVCPSCQQPSSAELWMIVDIEERPDLVKKIQAGTIHQIICEQGDIYYLDCPLLLCRPRSKPALLFSASYQASEEESEDRLGRLIYTLRHQMGAEWQAQWLEEDLYNLSRPLLGVVVASDPGMTLDEAKAALSHLAPDDPDRAMSLTGLGIGLWERYQRINLLPDLDNALHHWQEALTFMDEGSLEQTPLLSNLAQGWRARYLHTNELAELTRAVSYSEETLTLLPPHTSSRFVHQATLATCLWDRYHRTGRLDDLTRALSLWEDALAHLPATSPHRASIAVNLASGLNSHYASTNHLPDLKRAIALCEEALILLPHPTPARLTCLNTLAGGLRTYHAYQGHRPDLERTLALYEEALQLCPTPSLNRGSILTNVGTTLLDLYLYTDHLPDLAQAIDALSEALSNLPSQASVRPTTLALLGRSLLFRYKQGGNPADLARAHQLAAEADKLTPHDAPHRGLHQAIYAHTFHDTYTRTGNLAALEQALHHWEEAIASLPTNTADRAHYLGELAIGLRAYYIHTNENQTLARLIEVCEEALHLSKPHTPNRPQYLNELAQGLTLRYQCTGHVADLEQAIRCWEEALTLTPPSSPNYWSYLTTLAHGYHGHYGRTRKIAYLEKALRHYEQALAFSPPDGLAHGTCLMGLAGALSDRFTHENQPSSLEEALTLYQQALSLLPPDSREYAVCLASLALALRNRYDHSQGARPEDLTQALAYLEEAERLTPPSARQYLEVLDGLARVLATKHKWQRDEATLTRATQLYRKICQEGLLLFPISIMHSSQRWGCGASQRGDWEEACEAYAYSHRALTRLYQSQLRRTEREGWLLSSGTTAREWAYALSQLGQLHEATLVLEEGRTRELRIVLESDRAELGQLEKDYPALATAYREAANAMHRLRGQEGSHAYAPQEIQKAQRALDHASNAIRQVPGHEGFLTKPSSATLSQAVQPAIPLIYLLTGVDGSMALLLHRAKASDPITIEALGGSLTESRLREWLLGPESDPLVGGWVGAYAASLETPATPSATVPPKQEWRNQLERVTNQLGETLMAPIVARLRELQAHQAVLVPTGLLALLPLHAAWTWEKGQRRYALDEVAFSYSPSATALLAARRAARHVKTQRLVAIQEPRPVSAPPLPHATAEVAAIERWFPTSTRLRHQQATRHAVLTALAQADVVHFSCHGRVSWEEPMASALLLAHDEPLTVQDMLALSLKGARLATLAACETGLVGPELIDEMIGLPSALVQAGFAGVVASFWSVADRSTALLIARFYQLWCQEGLDPVFALQQAQRWLRDSSSKEQAALLTLPASPISSHQQRATQTKPQTDQATPPFEHPFWWAAFYLTGV